jgi:hypothetical protein
VHPEEVVALVAAAEATAHATTVVREATLLEIALMSRQVMPDRVAVAAVAVAVHVTATTVESLGILQGIAP